MHACLYIYIHIHIHIWRLPYIGEPTTIMGTPPLKRWAPDVGDVGKPISMSLCMGTTRKACIYMESGHFWGTLNARKRITMGP